MKVLRLSAFIFVIFTSSLGAQSIFETSDREQRRADKREFLAEPSVFQFLGWRRAELERLLDAEDSAGGDQETLLRLRSNFISIREPNQRVYTNGSDAFPVIRNNSTSQIQGLPLRYGENLVQSFELQAHHSDRVAAKLDASIGASFRNNVAWNYVSQAFVEARFRSLIFSVGRKPIYWGQSFVSPLLYGDNAKNLDSVQLESLAYRLPWYFKYFGPVRTQLFVSRLGRNRIPRKDWFAGWRIGMKPFDAFEFNAGVIYQAGGTGIPIGSFPDTTLELFGARGTGSSVDNQFGQSNIFNRAAAFDFRVPFKIGSVPMSLYSEQHLEDCCGKTSTVLNKSYNYLYGFDYRPSSSNWGDEIAVEYLKTTNALYNHRLWKSGTSNSGRLIGHEIGADAQGTYLRWQGRIFSHKLTNVVTLLWEERIRTAKFHDNGSFLEFKPGYESSEHRFGVFSSLAWQIRNPLRLDLAAGTERIFRLNFDSGKGRWAAASRVGIQVDL